MSLKIIDSRSSAVRGALAAAAFAAVLGAFFVIKWGFANMAAVRAETVEVAEFAAAIGPDDPQTHRTLAGLLEKTFLPADLERSLAEYEAAVAHAPGNYLYWLDLGLARSRAGDIEGAEAALRHTLELAPNYSSVQWALGNTLLRKGSTDEAFDLIAKAVDGNPSYREPAAGLAWIIFEGDVEAVRRAMGDSPPVIAALASTLAREERFDDAVRLWEQLPADEKRGRFKEVGAGLLAKLTAGSRFRQAMSVAASLGEGENAPSEIGRITNGGFESDVRIPATELFNWRIEDGLSPQIVVDAGNKQEGTRSLVIIIDSPDGRLTRSVTQTVAVEPGANYLFTAFYRSDTDSAKGWQWEVVDAAKRQPVAATPSTQAKADWTPLSVRFTAPSEVDGIIIRLVRAECGSPICPVKGRIWFDGLSLEKVAE